MRLLLVGDARPEVATAARLAAAGGAAVRHLATLDAALEQLRSGRESPTSSSLIAGLGARQA